MKTQNDAEWLAQHVPGMKKLKKPSLPQSVILELAEGTEIDSTDKRRLTAAITAEKAAIKARQMQNRLGAVLAREDTANRKMETRRKFILGDLVLAEARRNPEFHQSLLPIIKAYITAARDLAVLTPLLDEQPSIAEAGDQACMVSPSPVQKKAKRTGGRKSAVTERQSETNG